MSETVTTTADVGCPRCNGNNLVPHTRLWGCDYDDLHDLPLMPERGLDE